METCAGSCQVPGIFPLPLPRFSLTSASDSLQLPARERPQPGWELLLSPVSPRARGRALAPLLGKPGGQQGVSTGLGAELEGATQVMGERWEAGLVRAGCRAGMSAI